MTTYNYNLSLDDSEMMAFEEACKFYLAHCEAQLRAGSSVPFWAHRSAIENMLERKLQSVEQMSGNF